MAKDFRASQIELTKIILSGGIANTTVGGIIYSGSSATDREGGIAASMLSGVGRDVTLFISGGKSHKNHPPTGATGFKSGVVLFGGDVVVSGTLFADRQVIEVDETVTGSMLISGSLSVSQSAIINKGLEVNSSMGSTAGPGGDDFIHFGSSNGQQIITSLASDNQVLILSGGGITSTNEKNYPDMAFFVSGTVGSRNTTNRGTSLFGGDLVVSGAFVADPVPGLFSGGTLVVESGAVTVDATGVLALSSSFNPGTGASVQILASAGGIDIDAVGSASEDISITNTGGSIIISSTETVTDAINIDSSGGVDIDAAGTITIDGVGASNITTHGVLTLSGSDGLNIASDEGEIDLTSRQGAIDVNAGAALSLDGASGINIGTGTNVAVDLNASTLDIDATGAITIDGTSTLSLDSADTTNLTMAANNGGNKYLTIKAANTGGGHGTLNLTGSIVTINASSAINLGADMDVAFNIDTSTLDIDSSGAITIDGTSTFSIDGIGASNVTTKGALTISGSTGLNLASDGGEIDLTTRQGAVDINAHTGVTIDATAGNISIIADGTSNSVTIKGDNTNGTSIHLDGNQHANAVVLIDAGQLNVDAMSTVSIDTETTFSIDGITGNSNITQQKGTLLISGSTGLVLDSHGGPISIASTQAPVTINGEQVLILSGGGPTSPNEALYPDTNFFVSGTAGSRGTATRGTSVFGGDVVISGSLFGGSPLSVGGDLEVSGSVILTGDSPTEITGSLFITGSMTVTGSLTVSGSSTFTVYGPSIFNEGGTSDSDFRVETDNKTHAIFVNSATDQVLILSGGVGGRGATSYDEATAADVNFYVSGTAGSRGTATRGTSVFGGDLVVSGAMAISGSVTDINNSTSYLQFGGSHASDGKLVLGGIQVIGRDAGGTPDSIVINPEGSAISTLIKTNGKYALASKHTTNTVYVNSDNASEDGADTCFFVSGSTGTIGSSTRGVSTFGGDVVISGSLRARQQFFTTHTLTPGNNTACFVRFDMTGSDIGAGINNKMIAPYPGELLKVTARSTAVAGSTTIGLHTNTNTNTNLNGTSSEDVTVNMSADDTTYTFFFSPAANYGPGDIIGLKINPANTPGTTIITAVWEFNTAD